MGVNAETLASLTTAAGTLVLAVATFSSTRSANMASRTAERALLAGLRPVLMHARLDDPRQKVGFMDQRWLQFEGAGGAIDVTDDVIYLAAAIRNVGTGIAILQGWHTDGDRTMGTQRHAAIEDFIMLTRDIYIPAGDLGFWQGALRDRADPLFARVARSVQERRPITFDILYSDLHGSQQTITRLSLSPTTEDHWIGSVGRHWQVAEAPARRWSARRSGARAEPVEQDVYKGGEAG
jgi:hypothetical protein